jgi:hypothetical protein
MHATTIQYMLGAPPVLWAGHGVLAADLDAVLTSHPIRNRLLRLTANSPDLLGTIKQEGRV